MGTKRRKSESTKFSREKLDLDIAQDIARSDRVEKSECKAGVDSTFMVNLPAASLAPIPPEAKTIQRIKPH